MELLRARWQEKLQFEKWEWALQESEAYKLLCGSCLVVGTRHHMHPFHFNSKSNQIVCFIVWKNAQLLNFPVGPVLPTAFHPLGLKTWRLFDHISSPHVSRSHQNVAKYSLVELKLFFFYFCRSLERLKEFYFYLPFIARVLLPLVRNHITFWLKSPEMWTHLHQREVPS